MQAKASNETQQRANDSKSDGMQRPGADALGDVISKVRGPSAALCLKRRKHGLRRPMEIPTIVHSAKAARWLLMLLLRCEIAVRLSASSTPPYTAFHTISCCTACSGRC
jgi:hypothetical protein